MSTIIQDGATDIVYIQQTEGGFEYTVNQGDAASLDWPVTIQNTNASPSTNILKVYFATDLTLDNVNMYIVIASDGIQIGNTVVNNDGTKRTITIDGVSNYGGFVGNADGYSNTYIYNLRIHVSNGSTLNTAAGWVGRYKYGTDATTNFIINCSSNGDISINGGGIVGAEAATSTGGTVGLTIAGCTSSGDINTGGGGIAGEYVGNGGGIVDILKCSSSGSIASEAGGIAGQYAGGGGGNLTISKSYSTGSIGIGAGGICGFSAGDNGQVVVSDSYSRGSIGVDAGAIYGANAAVSGGTTIATNCYGIGPGDIYGSGAYEGASSTTTYIANPWSDSSAISAGLDLSAIYISTGTNQPYELRAIGPSPYSVTTITGEDATLSYSQSVAAGSSSIAAVLAGLSSFSILEIDGELPAETPSITINSTTGVVSTTSETAVGSYTIIVRAVTNPYSITTVTLTVTSGTTPATTTVSLVTKGKGYDFELYNSVRAGNQLVLERLQNTNLRFKSFEDYNKYRIALASITRA